MSQEKFNPITQVTEGQKKGWKFNINGEEMDVNSLDAFNPNVGHFLYGWNGRFDQPAIMQNPGRVVVYIADHPKHGLVMGGAEEPRALSNGTMFTPAGGFDKEKDTAEYEAIMALPETDEKLAKLSAYGKKTAAREALEEMGINLGNIYEAGNSNSNRAFFIIDLQDPTAKSTETTYVCEINPDLIGEDMTINLPEDKMGDVMPAPEWSGIKKLQFKTFIDCIASADGIAVTSYSKAYRWWKINREPMKYQAKVYERQHGSGKTYQQ